MILRSNVKFCLPVYSSLKNIEKENIDLEFRFKNIDKAKKNSLRRIKQRGLMNKTQKKLVKNGFKLH